MSRFQVPTTRQRQCLIMAAAFFVGKEKNNIKSVSETQQATKLYFFPQEEQGGILLFFTKEFQSEEKERQREKKLSQSQRQCFKTQKKNKNPISNGDVVPPPSNYWFQVCSVWHASEAAITCHSFHSVMNAGSACGCTLRNSKEETSRRKKRSGFLFIYAIKDICPT